MSDKEKQIADEKKTWCNWKPPSQTGDKRPRYEDFYSSVLAGVNTK